MFGSWYEQILGERLEPKGKIDNNRSRGGDSYHFLARKVGEQAIEKNPLTEGGKEMEWHMPYL